MNDVSAVSPVQTRHVRMVLDSFWNAEYYTTKMAHDLAHDVALGRRSRNIPAGACAVIVVSAEEMKHNSEGDP